MKNPRSEENWKRFCIFPLCSTILQFQNMKRTLRLETCLLTRLLHPLHRRRMEREAKTKVVASVWGGKGQNVFFLTAPAVLPRSIWKKQLNSTVSSKTTESKQLWRQEKEQIVPPKQTQRPLSCLLFPSFLHYMIHSICDRDGVYCVQWLRFI